MPRPRKIPKTPSERREYQRRRHAERWAADPEYKARKKAQIKRWAASDKGQARKRRHTRGIRFLVDVRKAVPCADCGGRFPQPVMEFDHRPGTEKRYEVARLSSSLCSASTLFAEIAKCDAVCANCHRFRTLARALDERYPVETE